MPAAYLYVVFVYVNLARVDIVYEKREGFSFERLQRDRLEMSLLKAGWAREHRSKIGRTRGKNEAMCPGSHAIGYESDVTKVILPVGMMP